MKISVLTPSFNSAKYIERAIQSVVSQDYKDWEHIVVDGGSTDGTVEILKSYRHLNWISEPDKGQSDAMNKAFRLSTGDIVIFLNSDDELASGYLTHLNVAFHNYPDADMIVSNLYINRMGEIHVRRASVNLKDILRHDRFKFPLNPVSYAYKRSLQIAVGPFPVTNHFTMDYWFLLRAYRIGKIVKSEDYAGTFYFDGTNKSSDFERAMNDLRKVRNKFLIRYFYSPSVIIFLIRQLAQCKGLRSLRSRLEAQMK